MSIQSKVYKWETHPVFFSGVGFVDVGEWVLKSTTEGLSYATGLSLFDSGKVIFWRVDTYDTETELTTTGDVWVFYLAPLIVTNWNDGSLIGYDIIPAGQVAGYTTGTPWIPGNYILVLPGEIADYPLLDLPNDQIEFNSDFTVATLKTYLNVEWQFIDGSWQWSDVQNFVGGGRYQNLIAAFSHDKILIESF